MRWKLPRPPDSGNIVQNYSYFTNSADDRGEVIGIEIMNASKVLKSVAKLLYEQAEAET